MKKLLLFFAIIVLSCSKDDSTEVEQPINDNWTFYYRDSCDIYQASGSICLPKDEYDQAMENKIFVDQTCFKIKIDNVWYIWFGAINICD